MELAHVLLADHGQRAAGSGGPQRLAAAREGVRGGGGSGAERLAVRGGGGVVGSRSWVVHGGVGRHTGGEAGAGAGEGAVEPGGGRG